MSAGKNENFSFWDHLEEFRWRLIAMIVAWLVGSVLCFPVSDFVMAYISRPVGPLIFLSLSEALVIRCQLSLICGALVAAPVWMYQMMRFLWGGLRPPERRACCWAVCCVFFMSLLGVALGDRVVAPFAVRFFLTFSTPSLYPMLSAGHYLSFYCGLLVLCGLIFNLPFFLVMLAWMGIISGDTLRTYRRHVYVGCFVIGAILTPPDVFTQVVTAILLCLLYELSIIGVMIVLRR